MLLLSVVHVGVGVWVAALFCCVCVCTWWTWHIDRQKAWFQCNGGHAHVNSIMLTSALSQTKHMLLYEHILSAVVMRPAVCTASSPLFRRPAQYERSPQCVNKIFNLSAALPATAQTYFSQCNPKSDLFF